MDVHECANNGVGVLRNDVLQYILNINIGNFVVIEASECSDTVYIHYKVSTVNVSSLS